MQASPNLAINTWLLYQGDEFSVEFTEEIFCAKPFRFSVQLDVLGYDRVLTEDNMHVLCNHNKIRLALPASTPYDDVMVC